GGQAGPSASHSKKVSLPRNLHPALLVFGAGLRLRRSLIAIATFALVAGCGGQTSGPVSPADCQATAPHRVGTTLAVDVDPTDSTIRGLLPDGAAATAGRPFPVRWVMDARKAGPEMRMRALREGTNEVIDETWRGTTSGQLAEYAAEITFPK